MKRSIALVATIALLAVACTNDVQSSPSDSSTQPTVGRQVNANGTVLLGGYFQEFSSCDALLDYFVTNALDVVGPWGFGGAGGLFYAERDEFATEDAAQASSAGGDFTGTNVQVSGVDEGDIVKTDGKRIFMLGDGGLRVAMVTDDGVEFTDQMRLDWWPQSMMLKDDTLVLMGVVWNEGGGYGGGYGYGGGSSTTKIVEVDISDISDVSVIRTLELDGSFVSARLVDSQLRVAMNSQPVGLPFVAPEGNGLRAERQATEANKDIIKASTLDNWLPYFVLNVDGRESDGQLLDCSKVMAPTTFAGIDTLGLLSFDLDRGGISEWEAAGVVASGATMYANEERTYLATARWTNWGILSESDAEAARDGFSTDIHEFDTSGASPQYVGSGTIKGFLLNQFAMDEFAGHLRVASTTAPNWWGSSFKSESQVTVFELTGGDLEQVGLVDGLGVTEQIYSVRFMGDLGYVVTFRQTDPLYVVDLADPSDPTVVGELKIPGYSAYLHPVADGRLLGVGQNADENGATQGTQMSLFDVSDPANPRQLDTVMVDDAWSSVEYDHKAFTFTNNVAFAPFESWMWDEETEKETFDNGVMAVTVGSETLDLTTILRPVTDGPVSGAESDWEASGINPWTMATQRTIRIDDRLYLVTNGGIAVFDADSFERIEYQEF